MNETNNNSTSPQARCEPSAGSMRVGEGPILAPRDEVQAGYERGMLSALPGTDGCFSKPSENRYEFCLWDLWHGLKQRVSVQSANKAVSQQKILDCSR